MILVQVHIKKVAFTPSELFNPIDSTRLQQLIKKNTVNSECLQSVRVQEPSGS